MTKTKLKKPNLSKAMQGNTNSVGNKGGTGRPSLWREDLPDDMWKYLDETKDKEIKTQFGIKIIPNIPMLCGVALELRMSEETLLVWYNNFKNKSSSELTEKELSFIGAYEAIKAEQQKRLINNGLGGGYNGHMSKFMLSSNHGMTDRVDHTTGGDKISAFGLGHAELKKLEEEARA